LCCAHVIPAMGEKGRRGSDKNKIEGLQAKREALFSK
jgi:hypothetical protein